MPDKHPDTERWGGPGASHEDRSKPMPQQDDPRPDGTPTNPSVSRVSGGGGERDEKHSHVNNKRSSKSASTTAGREWQENQPRKE